MFARSVLALVVAQLIEFRRSRTALFWTLAFPVGFLLLFGFVMARGDARVTAILLPGLLTTTLLSGGVFGVALPLVQLRENGWLRRLRVTPVRVAAITLAHGFTALMTSALSLLVLLALARALFGVTSAGRPASLAIVFLCGAWALLPIGLVVGSAARDMKTAPAVANLLFFPLMFLSGSAFPFAFMPEGVKRVARLLPTTYLVDAYTSVFVRGESAWSIAGSLAAMGGIGIVGLWMAVRLFRWEGTDPLPRRALATIAVGFGAVLGVAAFAAPAFRHGEIASARRIEAGPATGQLRILRGATVIDGLGGRIDHARLVIRDNRIDSLEPDDERFTTPANAIVEDWTGRFIVPGLIDSHVHWGGSGGVSEAPIERTDDRLMHDLTGTLASGVTSVVSLTDDLTEMQGLAAAVARGVQTAPRTFFAGPSVTAPGGHPSEMFGFLPGLADRLTRQVDTPEAARAAIAELDRARVDLVKLVLEPGVESPLPRMKEEVFRAAVDEAKKRRLRTTVHVGTDADVVLAVEAGANGIEHASRGLTDRTLALMAAKRVWFTPTIVVFDFPWKRRVADGLDLLVNRRVAPGLLESMRDPASPLMTFINGERAAGLDGAHRGSLDQTRRAIRAGVPILAGSDAGNPLTFHGVSLVRELELLAEAGMPLGDVLRAATSRAADRLGQPTLGRIGAGAVADLVVLDADPLEGVGAYRQVRAVYLGGRRLDPEALDPRAAGPWHPGQS